jgi:hypothetical protein
MRGHVGSTGIAGCASTKPLNCVSLTRSRDHAWTQDRPGVRGRRLPMDLDGRDIRDKLYGATRRLASGTAPLKARLRAALTAELIALRAEDFPWPDLGERWSGVVNELAPDQRPIIILEQWWDFELIRIAQEIVDIYDQMSRRLQAE